MPDRQFDSDDRPRAAGANAFPSAPVRRREVFGWCMYDFADSAFTTIIVTTLYALYYKKIVVADDARGDLLWGLAASTSEIAVALIAPILGAIADFSGTRKRFLAVFALGVVLFTSALYFVGPGKAALGFVLYILANIAFTGGGIFIDSFLPGISNETNAGRISGLKWGLGYLGGLLALVACGSLASSIVSDPTADQVAQARLVPVMVAVWYGLAVIPTFLFLRDRSVAKGRLPGEGYVRVGFRRLWQTMRQVRRYRELFKLLVAFVVYNDGIVTVITFAALYAEQTIGFTPGEIVTMFILMNVVALVGAASFGWLADRVGQKRTIAISLTLWFVATLAAFFAESKSSFYVVAFLAGLGMGSCQSVTRSLVAVFTPKPNAAEFAGFLGFAGKAVAFLGPMVFGIISHRTGSQRLAILSVGLFFVVGLLLLLRVDEAKGKAAAQWPVE